MRRICRLAQLLCAQRRALRELSDFAVAATELTPPASCLNHPALASALAVANDAFLAAHTSLCDALATLEAATLLVSARHSGSPDACNNSSHYMKLAPVLFTDELVAAMRGAAAAIAAAEADVAASGRRAVPGLNTPELAGELTVARLHPALPRFHAALVSAQNSCHVPEATQPCPSAAQASHAQQDAVAPQRTPAACAIALAAAVEAALQQALLWAQGPFDTPAENGSAAFVAALQRVCSLLSARAYPALVSALSQCAHALRQPLPGPLPRPLLQQLSRVLSMVDTVRAGLWATVMSAVTLHSAGTRLTVASAAAFVAYMKDGFGRGEADEEDGETEEGAAGEGAGAPCLAIRARAAIHCAFVSGMCTCMAAVRHMYGRQ